jgi:hypothetical protein
MTACFLLPFSMGICEATGNNIVTDAFGTVAMVAMTPLIAIQILGVVYKIKLKKAERAAAIDVTEEITEFDTREDTKEVTITDMESTASATYVDDEIIDF